jgi:linearmycin/streptolysin S transport system permease protein
MRILGITIKDLHIFFLDRSNYIWVFVLPMVFIVLFTFVSSAAQNRPAEETAIKLAVLDLDGGSGPQDLIKRLEETGEIKVETLDSTAVEQLRSKGDLVYLLTIPAGFSSAVSSGQPTTLNLEKVKGTDNEFESLRLIVEGVAGSLSLESDILESLVMVGEMQKAASDAPQLFTVEQMQAQAKSQFEESRTRPLVVISSSSPQTILERQKDKTQDVSWAQSVVPGFTVLFVFMTAGITALSIYEEKRVGSFRRLLAAPLRRSSVMVGKLFPNFIVVIIQVVVLFAASLLLLPLIGSGDISLGNDPLALVLLCMAMALCATALGLAISALARTESQISGGSQLFLWVTGLLGGCLVPLTLFNSPVLISISRFVPQSWAIQGLQDLMVRGLGMQAVLPEIGALLAFSLVFFLVGALRFDFD